ncbi:MAG: CDP-diacylglycerol--serine O-phosphatidyltransferase [Candidatus Rokubacteria bacterium]|nr:CDP-diacylglycerol--serine O-phosphatidyltransferase [Candidatus Rokubacteria bacterium]
MRRRPLAGDGHRGPRRRRWERLREHRQRGIFLLPSLLTTGNLFCGFLALILATRERYTEAAAAIFVAMVLDFLDGKVARLTRTTTQFGVEFDSLADVVSFCVAPAFLVYSAVLAPLGRAAWLAAFLFVICGALRLARFNVHAGVTDRRFFVGLSTPAGAGVLCAIILLVDGDEVSRWLGFAIAVAVYLTGLLMVSTFRYHSFKEVDFARRRPAGVLLVVVLGLLIVATHPQWFLFLLFTTYALSGPARPLWVRRREGSFRADVGPRDAH